MKFFVSCILCFSIYLFPSLGFSQTPTQMSYKIERGTYRLYYGDLKISFAKAKQLSLEQSKLDAFESFSKAKKVRNWSVIWSVFGNIELFSGSINSSIASQETDPDLKSLFLKRALFNYVIGAGAIGVQFIPSRNQKFAAFTRQAVEEFNSEL